MNKLKTTFKGFLNESEDTSKILIDIAQNLAEKMHCDIGGSCVHFAEEFTELVNSINPTLLDEFDVVEGWVDAKMGEGIPQEHTWIELHTGEKIDPTFSQFSKWGWAHYSKRKPVGRYSGKEYLISNAESWFKERRTKFPEMVFKSQGAQSKNSNLDLYDIAKRGLEGDYSFSSCWDDNATLEDAIQCVISDFESFLSTPYPIGLGNIPDNPIIYRLVRLKTIDDLKKDKLGLSWFSNPNQTDVPGFFDMLDYLKPKKTDEGTVYIIKGQISKDNIDMENTLWERSTQWIENEIVLLDDSNVNILEINEF